MELALGRRDMQQDRNTRKVEQVGICGHCTATGVIEAEIAQVTKTTGQAMGSSASECETWSWAHNDASKEY